MVSKLLCSLCTEAVPEKGFFMFYISYVMTVLQTGESYNPA